MARNSQPLLLSLTLLPWARSNLQEKKRSNRDFTSYSIASLWVISIKVGQQLQVWADNYKCCPTVIKLIIV